MARFAAPILVLLTICTVWGQKDLVRRDPPPLSDTAFDQIWEQYLGFADNDSWCNAPGVLKTDSSCYNPLHDYICKLRDTSIVPTALDSIEAKTALYTYMNFTQRLAYVAPKYSNSHIQFNSFLVNKEEQKDPPFFLKFLVIILEVISKYAERLLNIIAVPFSSLSTGLKIVFLTIASIVIMSFLAFIAQMFSKALPNPEYMIADANQTQSKDARRLLSEARIKCNEGKFYESSEILYNWLLQWSSENRIRQSDWWTNRQLVGIIKKRYPQFASYCKQIIDIYETHAFGHKSVEETHLREALDKAALMVRS